ncbi:hypothetical protein YC2023_019568 [Brassica napus]
MHRSQRRISCLLGSWLRKYYGGDSKKFCPAKHVCLRTKDDGQVCVCSHFPCVCGNMTCIKVRFRRGSLRNGYHIQGRQQARKLLNPNTGRLIRWMFWKQARRENQKLDENPNFGILKSSMKPKDREIFSLRFRDQFEFIKNVQSIRKGVEKYLGLIAGQKFTGRVTIRRTDREARGGSLHGIRTWCQPFRKLSVYRISRCHRAWKLHMHLDM